MAILTGFKKFYPDYCGSIWNQSQFDFSFPWSFFTSTLSIYQCILFLVLLFCHSCAHSLYFPADLPPPHIQLQPLDSPKFAVTFVLFNYCYIVIGYYHAIKVLWRGSIFGENTTNFDRILLHSFRRLSLWKIFTF